MNESQKEKLLEYFSKCKKQRTLDIDNGKWSVEEVDIYMYLSDARQHESYIVRLGKSNIIFNTNDSIIYKICDGDIVNADISVLLTGGLLFGMLPAAAFADGEQGISFNDVKEADWFYDSVQYVCENEMMSGTGDTVFSPDAATTRGMLVTILYRMEGSPAVDGDMKFTDVSADRYYAAAAAWASENNIGMKER